MFLIWQLWQTMSYLTHQHMWIYHIHIQHSKAKDTATTFPRDFLDINADILGHWLLVTVQTYKCCLLYGDWWEKLYISLFTLGAFWKALPKLMLYFVIQYKCDICYLKLLLKVNLLLHQHKCLKYLWSAIDLSMICPKKGKDRV